MNVRAIAAVPSTPTNYYRNGSYDYVETTLGLGRAAGSDAVVSYDGVSSGSLWRVQIFQGKDGAETSIITWPYLMGVNFWQGNAVDGVRILRSHGPKTIYESLLPKLLTV